MRFETRWRAPPRPGSVRAGRWAGLAAPPGSARAQAGHRPPAPRGVPAARWPPGRQSQIPSALLPSTTEAWRRKERETPDSDFTVTQAWPERGEQESSAGCWKALPPRWRDRGRQRYPFSHFLYINVDPMSEYRAAFVHTWGRRPGGSQKCEPWGCRVREATPGPNGSPALVPWEKQVSLFQSLSVGLSVSFIQKHGRWNRCVTEHITLFCFNILIWKWGLQQYLLNRIIAKIKWDNIYKEHKGLHKGNLLLLLLFWWWTLSRPWVNEWMSGVEDPKGMAWT